LVTRNNKLIQWRRQQVESYLIRGYSTYQIADKLQCAQSTVFNDKTYLDTNMREESEEYIRRLPGELRRIRVGVNHVLQLCWSIADDTKLDPKVRLQAGSLANDSYRLFAELADGSVDVDKLSSILVRTRDKVEDIVDKKKEVTVF
jgi:hypothetical protein